MYDGVTLAICKDIVEANWLEYLVYVKRQSDKELERNKKRQEALKSIEGYELTTSNTIEGAKLAAVDMDNHRYYDLSLNSFWSWYIQYKLEETK